jgi:hypothetical protein
MRNTMETVYLESTIISYLVSNPSRDLIVAAHQQITREWWARRRQYFSCSISQVVLDEIARGDVEQVKRRLAVAQGLPRLRALAEAERLTVQFLQSGALPAAAARDAAHVAIATVARMDYLLTWNCRHIANAQILRKLAATAASSGYTLPDVRTPEELMGDIADEEL